MSHGKQFTLYSHAGGPNPWCVHDLCCVHSTDRSLLYRKVAFLLNELAIPYEAVYLDLMKGDHKAPEYLKINPNGRVPALIDHKNNDYTVW